MKKLNDYFPITSDGLFTAFNNPVWCVSFPDTSILDIYFFNRYGDKFGTKILHYYEDAEDGTIKDNELKKLALLIYNIKGKSWEHLYNIYTSEYNPIENTDFVETITESTGNTKIIDGASTSTGTAETHSSATTTGSNSGANNVFGFNSTNAVGESTSTGANSDETYANSTTTTSGGTTEDSTITDNGTHTSEHRKHGNIGVTSNVELMTQDVEFWKWSFIDSVCRDICDIIALSIY